MFTIVHQACPLNRLFLYFTIGTKRAVHPSNSWAACYSILITWQSVSGVCDGILFLELCLEVLTSTDCWRALIAALNCSSPPRENMDSAPGKTRGFGGPATEGSSFEASGARLLAAVAKRSSSLSSSSPSPNRSLRDFGSEKH
jgi:hypothetical protein